jgi:hypothetical protein
MPKWVSGACNAGLGMQKVQLGEESYEDKPFAKLTDAEAAGMDSDLLCKGEIVNIGSKDGKLYATFKYVVSAVWTMHTHASILQRLEMPCTCLHTCYSV